jgi:hypothetical protein
MNSEGGLLTPCPVGTSICGANIPEIKKSLLITGFNLCTRKQLRNRSLLMNQSINYYFQENYEFSERRFLKEFSLRET